MKSRTIVTYQVYKVGDRVDEQIRRQFGTPGSATGGNIWADLVWAQIYNEVYNPVRGQVGDQIIEQAKEEITVKSRKLSRR